MLTSPRASTLLPSIPVTEGEEEEENLATEEEEDLIAFALRIAGGDRPKDRSCIGNLGEVRAWGLKVTSVAINCFQKRKGTRMRNPN